MTISGPWVIPGRVAHVLKFSMTTGNLLRAALLEARIKMAIGLQNSGIWSLCSMNKKLMAAGLTYQSHLLILEWVWNGSPPLCKASITIMIQTFSKP